MSDYMCPNCVTPWKCNGPHIPEAVSDRPIHEVLAEISAKVPPEEWAKLDKTHYADPDTLATLAKLERDNAALRAELNDLRVRVASRDIAIGTIDDILEACAEVLGHDVVLVELPGELAALRAELEGVRKDAERYRWLRDLSLARKKMSVYVGQTFYSGDVACNRFLHGKEMDAAVDDAIAQGKGEK